MLALSALEGGAAAGTEGADSVGLLRTDYGHQALGQRSVEVAARGVARPSCRDPAVALS